MSRIVVLSWPRREAVLFSKRFGRVQRIDAVPGPITSLPEAWQAKIDEIRVVVETGILHRPVDLEGLSGPALEEAARYAIEPSLPLPLSEIAFTLLRQREKNGPRHFAAVISRRDLDAIQSWAGSCAIPVASRNAFIPITWIGPFSAALLGAPVQPDKFGVQCGATWIAETRDGAWRTLQCARSEEEIAALASGREIDRSTMTRIGFEELAEQVAALSATRGGGNWVRVQHRTARFLRHGPAAIAVVALLFFGAAFGLKVAALQNRSRTAETAVAEAFAAALPGTRMVSPGEQLASRVKTARSRNEVLRDRMIKQGSALEILAIVEAAVPQEEAVIDDLRITADEIVLVGSARSMEAVQRIKQSLDAPRDGTSRIRTAEPETRRSPAGLGVDFSLRGER